MKALLLAAGLGTRLKPITDTVPKCLVPIDGRPLLDYWICGLSQVGVTHFYINLHYHSDAVRGFIASRGYDSKVTLLNEPELVGTGGTLKKWADYFLDESFILAHADNLCLTNFENFIETHRSRPDGICMTMMTFDADSPESCGIVELDSKKIVIDFFEKIKNPPSALANGAVFVMEPEVAEYCKGYAKDKFELSLDVIPNFKGRILAWHNSSYHLDIGTLKSYDKANNEIDTIKYFSSKYSYFTSS